MNLRSEDGARAGVDWCELDISRYCWPRCTGLDKDRCSEPVTRQRLVIALCLTLRMGRGAHLRHQTGTKKYKSWLSFIKTQASVLPRLVYNILTCCYVVKMLSKIRHKGEGRHIHIHIHTQSDQDSGLWVLCILLFDHTTKNTLKLKKHQNTF